jgi:hypothetical protein
VVAMDDVVDVMDVELASAVALDRLGDVLDESCELGFVVGGDDCARYAPSRL